MEHIAQIRKFVIDRFLFGNGEQLRDDTSFIGERVVDSTGMIELISYVEMEFGIKVEDNELTQDNLDSLSKIAAFIRRKKAGADGQGAAPN
jgi:acyl carrier protein